MFTAEQSCCLRALLDTLIPADDYPGAWAAGVGDYVLRQLQGDLAHLLPAYRLWLRCLDAEALCLHDRGYADLSLDLRTRLLSRIESGALETEWALEPAKFFVQIVEHCAEGYYSDPGNGGNRDGIAWDMIGYQVTL